MVGCALRLVAVVCVAVGAAGCVRERPRVAGSPSQATSESNASAPDVTQHPLREAYFGELHLHTSFSSDALIFGTFIDPQMAYRFARGERVETPIGESIQLATPLDFMAVTDHSEWFGEVQMTLDPQHPSYDADFARQLRDGWRSEEQAEKFMWKDLFGYEKSGKRPDFSGPDGRTALAAAPVLWKRTIDAAEQNNSPGRFTTFIGFEWTATPAGNNLHRNLIFRTAKVPSLPVSFFEARTPEALWTWTENSAGGAGNVLAIPHNSNLSNGLMFEPVSSNGRPYDAATAARRATLEPLIEIAQRKGTSESNATFAPNDEFINFELMPADYTWSDTPAANGRFSWAREGLKEGLVQAARIGVNPFQFGFVGGTDNHSGLGGDVSEKDTIRDISRSGRAPNAGPTSAPGALTAVWAEANTRENIWQALKRREVYATSGTRIKTRLFGGWEYRSGMMENAQWLENAYRTGVPMGARFGARPKGRSPTLLVWALKAVDGMPLDRIQIIKGWEEGGSGHEQIYDVVCAGGRLPDTRTHACSNSGASVRAEDCSPGGAAGATELSAVWTDPQFSPDHHAFYYARVLENPSCRWTTFAALRQGKTPRKDVPLSIVERAWTSPVWYSPTVNGQ